jgi:hypothetical protein
MLEVNVFYIFPGYHELIFSQQNLFHEFWTKFRISMNFEKLLQFEFKFGN